MTFVVLDGKSRVILVGFMSVGSHGFKLLVNVVTGRRRNNTIGRCGDKLRKMCRRVKWTIIKVRLLGRRVKNLVKFGCH